jgi:alkaline phosphatase
VTHFKRGVLTLNPPSRQQASGGRVVTAGVGHQKPSKTVTARITARQDFGRIGPSNLHVMSMTPPMSSVIIERHQPVSQVTTSAAGMATLFSGFKSRMGGLFVLFISCVRLISHY